MLDETSDRTSRFAVLAAGLLLSLCLAQVAYRLSLPSDGWYFPLELSAGEQRYIISTYLGNAPTPLLSGDVLLQVESQTVEEIIGRAIRFTPQRPENWSVGQRVRYLVLRNGRQVELDVLLERRSFRSYALQWMRSAFRSPALLLGVLISLFVFGKKPVSPAAQIFLLSNVAQFTNLLSTSLNGQNSGPTELFYRGAYWPAWFFNFLIFPLLIVPLLPQLIFLIFPVRSEWQSRHWRVALTVIYALPLVLLSAGFVTHADQPLQFWRVPPELGSQIIFPFLVLVSTGRLLSVIVADPAPVKKAQAQWLVTGLIVGWGIGEGVFFFLPELGLIGKGPLTDFIVDLFGVFFPISIAVAILRYRLFDIGRIINRALVYSILTAVLGMIYFISVIAFQTIFRPLFGQESQLVVVISTLSIAALFNPLRRGIQHFIDRRFFRARYDAAQVLAVFSASVRNEVDMETISESLLRVVKDTIQPEHVSIWLRGSKE